MRRRSSVLVLATALATVHVLSGQEPKISRDLLDGTTHPGIASGGATGSYPLSGFESVNLFSGGLNVSLPLLAVGGRGDVQYTMTLPLERRWIVDRQTGAGGEVYLYPGQVASRVGVMYGPGFLEKRVETQSDFCLSETYDQITLTRLHFYSPDGNDQELLDAITNGGFAGTGKTCGPSPTFAVLNDKRAACWPPVP